MEFVELSVVSFCLSVTNDLKRIEMMTSTPNKL